MKSLLFAIPLLAAGVSSAATITILGGSPSGTGTTTVNLPSAAGTDWGLWGSSANPTVGTASITSNAGSQLFTVTAVGGGAGAALRGSGTGANTRFTFTNGDPTLTGTNLQVGGIFNTNGIGNNLNAGVGLTLTTISEPVRIQLYTYFFESTATLNVYLDGSSTPAYTNSFTDITDGGKNGRRYGFDYVPDSSATTVRFELIKTGSDDPSSNVGFTGISITPIPEPASFALFGAAALTGLLRRRRA